MRRGLGVTTAVLLALTAACGGSSHGSSAGGSTASSAAALLNQGLAKQKAGDTAGAKALFQEVLDKDPQSYVAHYDLGTIAQGAGDTTGALSEYALALAIDASYVPALYNTAVIYGTTDRALAISTYRRVVQLQPIAPTAYLNLGLTEIATGETVQGVADVRTAIEQDPTLAPGLPADVRARLAAPAGKAPASASPRA